MSRENLFEWGNKKSLDECLAVLDHFFNIQYNTGEDADTATWWYKIGPNFPKYEPLYIYFVMNNEVRWRFNFVDFADHSREGKVLNKGGLPVVMKGKFIVCCGPAVKAPFSIPWKGFQGFRYSQTLY